MLNTLNHGYFVGGSMDGKLFSYYELEDEMLINGETYVYTAVEGDQHIYELWVEDDQA